MRELEVIRLSLNIEISWEGIAFVRRIISV
jgi:hypothetical protein